jgi:hypothetical protein
VSYAAWDRQSTPFVASEEIPAADADVGSSLRPEVAGSAGLGLTFTPFREAIGDDCVHGRLRGSAYAGLVRRRLCQSVLTPWTSYL